MKSKMIKLLHQHTKKITKQIKNKTSKSNYKPCEQFCKKDYMVEIDKVYRKSAKKWKQPYKSTKEDLKFRYDVCKKTFCNSKCEGYPIQIKHKNGFQKEYTTPQVEKLKEKGALSGCVYTDYNMFH
jgi:hypothetical protein